ncbi:protocadherin Fat 4-like [Protopterus annectens]|uniref:protocadherin Fat 4-like n=1 Tax=Protopterus annectens TaxID=7888 RepID=UPI001CF9F686|nr:protocadherin Fat 4-like [Protopterus annectens]
MEVDILDPGHMVLACPQLNLLCQNAALNYTICSGDAQQCFTINSNGTLQLQKHLDREQQSVYNLIIQAADKSVPESSRLSSSMHITLYIEDINDNVPCFVTTNYICLSENVTVGTIVTVIQATDLDTGDNGVVVYETENLTHQKFAINKTSGELLLTGALDRETINQYFLKVVARDKGLPSLSSVLNMTVDIADINDNSPSFTYETYNITVYENIALGSELLTVSASDPDYSTNGEVRYATPCSELLIDSVTGLIIVVKKLDRERTPVYTFVVTASDKGIVPKFGKATVNIILLDVNDDAPAFQSETINLHLPENITHLPQSVYLVSAQDNDLEQNSYIVFAIKKGNEAGKFSLSSAGQLSVLQSLDREEVSEYQIIVTATDSGVPQLTGTQTIIITVDDVNDNYPVFDEMVYSASVSESVPIGTSFFKVKASDLDEGLNGDIRYSLISGGSHFNIDPLNGDILTSSLLDREMEASYTLTIMANDRNIEMPLSCLVTVVVTVEDVNDEVPKFLNAPYVANVPMFLQPG